MSDYTDTTADPSTSLLAPDWQSKLGGLLGGPDESTIAPIVGQQGLANARSNALLNLGVGLMNAGGWHPTKVSMGQALAQGIQAAQQGYQGTLDSALKTAGLSQQLQMARFTMAGKLQQMRTIQAIQAARLAAANGQPPPAQDPGATGDVSATPVSMAQPQGAPLGGAVPPMGAGGAAAPQGPAQGAGPAPGGAPMPMPQQGPRMPQAAPQAPPSTKGSGIDPALIQDMVMSSAAYDPANLRGYVAMGNMMLPDVSVAPDGTVFNKHDYSNIGAFHGKLAGGNATLVNGVVTPRPGASDTVSALAAAKLAGENTQTLVPGAQDASGAPLPATTVAQAINGGQGGGLPPIPSTPGLGAGQGTGAAGAPPLPPMIGQGGADPSAVQGAGTKGGVYLAPPQGATSAINELSKTNAQKYSDLTTQASGSPDRLNTLSNILDLANGSTKFGPGTSGRLDNIAKINARVPPQFQFSGDAATDAQVMQKYTAFLSGQYQKSLGGNGSDLQLNTVLKGTPSPEMANAAIREVVPKLQAMELAVQAKANGADQWVAAHGNNPQTLNQFESIWRQNYDPRVFQAQQMEPNARAAFIKSQPDAGALIKKAQTAYQNGWIQ